jgi:hypothetical protein
VLRVDGRRPGAVQLAVDVEGALGGEARALAYPALTGPVGPGDAVVLNTTAVDMGLGSGGWHFVIAVDRPGDDDVTALEGVPPGRTMKLRYTPMQVAVETVEEERSPHRPAMATADSLEQTPVVWVPLHSMVAPVVAGARAAGAQRVALVWTDGAALPVPWSRACAELREEGLLEAVVSTGQAFGGDLEAINVFSGLLAARHVAGADVVVVGDGPGNTGTRTRWGASNVVSAMALNAAGVLGGRPVAALRISFADPRPEHRGVSHHSLTALSRVALVATHVAVPAVDDDAVRDALWDSLRDAGLEERHQLVEANGFPALELLATHGFEVESMGRSYADDPVFFLAAGAGGVLAGRMAAHDRAWRTDQDDPDQA